MEYYQRTTFIMALSNVPARLTIRCRADVPDGPRPELQTLGDEYIGGEIMEVTLYDGHGHPEAYIADDSSTIYLWSGHAVVYIDQGGLLYGWDGHHLGWFVGGVLYDTHGYRVGSIAAQPLCRLRRASKARVGCGERREPHRSRKILGERR